jgi:hypothetical protein
VVELVDAGRGLTVTRRLLEGLAKERAHYPTGASAWGRIGEVLG